MQIIVTEEFEKRYKCLPKQIQKKAEKQEKFFKKIHIIHRSTLKN